MQVELFGVKDKIRALDYAITNLRQQSPQHAQNKDNMIFHAIAHLCLIREAVENAQKKEQCHFDSYHVQER